MGHPTLTVDKTKVSQSTTRKYLVLVRDNVLLFEEYLTTMGAEVSTTITLLRKRQHLLSFHSRLS